MAGPSVMPLQLEEVDPEGDIDNQRERWESIDEQRQLWDAHDEQHKLRKKEERRQKQEERRQKQEERRQKQEEMKQMQENNKKIKLEFAQKKEDKKKKKLELSLRKKELQDKRDNSATDIKDRRKKLKRAEGGGSPHGCDQVCWGELFEVSSWSSSKCGSFKKREAAVGCGWKFPFIDKFQVCGEFAIFTEFAIFIEVTISGDFSIEKFHLRRRKVRRLTSTIWKDFIPHYDDGKLVQAECKHCNEVMAAGREMGTSGLGRHLATCPIRSDLHLIVEKLKYSVTSPHASVLKNWEFDQKKSRQLLARMIVRDELPFSIVEYSGFGDFVKSLNPLFKMVSRNTIKDDIMQLYYDKKSYMEKGFKMFAGRVSLTTDMWTSNQTLGYMCVTCHFIDMKWKLHKRIIRFCMLETPHNGVAMFNVLLKSLQELNLEDKLFSVTVDNASVNGSMIDNLRENLVSKEMLHYEGALLHIRCACHVFNLIAQDGLVAVKSSIDNIRESVKYVKSSQTRLENFTEIVGRVGVSCALPSVDVQTRWNSTYLMLESAIPFRKVFHTLAKEDTNYKFSPSSTEWRRAETVCSILKVFHTATNLVSASSYPTSNLYFHEVWNVKLVLEKEASRKDEHSRKDGVINSMLEEMQEKFNKYWVESYLANSIAIILDPRFKKEFIDFRLKQAFGPDAKIHIEKVEAALIGLFNEYSSEMSISCSQSAETEHTDEAGTEQDNLADWDQHLSKKQRQSNNELDRYLQEDVFPRKEDLDILQWWALHCSKYHVLSRIARDVLAVPASVVPSESAFSTGHRVVSDYRSRLKPSTVEALICLQDWLKEYESLADIIDDSDL